MFLKKIFAFALVATLVLVNVESASASEATDGTTTVTWDESSMYVPSGCSSFTFNYTSNATRLYFSNIVLVNAYGDNLGQSLTFNKPSGTTSIQVCYNKDFTPPLKLRLGTEVSGGSWGTTDFAFSLIPRPSAPVPTTKKFVSCKNSKGKISIFQRATCPSGYKLVKRY